MRHILAEAGTGSGGPYAVPNYSQPERASAPELTRRYLDVKETAARWGVSDRFVRRAVYEGKIPYYKFGKLVRLDVSDVDAFAAAGRIEATDQP